MVNQRRVLLIALCWAVVVVGMGDVRSEVSAEVNAFGEYVRTSVFANASVKNLKIWSVQRAKDTTIPLNVDGDATGDLWPRILEDPSSANRPWVVWSRFIDGDYDLAWSRFEADASWSPILGVLDPSGESSDDLDPRMILDDETGRPYLVWWRLDENGVGRILLSMFLNSRWMPAFSVTDGGVDSRFPEIELLEDNRIRVAFETPDGPDERIIVFQWPGTITDDLSPFESFVEEDSESTIGN